MSSIVRFYVNKANISFLFRRMLVIHDPLYDTVMNMLYKTKTNNLGQALIQYSHGSAVKLYFNIF